MSLSAADNNNIESAPHLLIVVSDKITRNLISDSLQSAGYSRLTFADSAQKALRIIRNQHIDVLIGDIDIEDLDGWRLSRLVRSGTLNCPSDLPIVLIATTWCERIAVVTAREYGVNQLLSLERIADLPEKIDGVFHRQSNAIGKPRLLVVEDQKDTSDLIQRVLNKVFTIEVAEDGEAGLNAWKNGQHDLILLDIMLPKLSGRDVLVEIMKEKPDQAVVIMTAHTTDELAEELMVLGGSDFLSKPFRPEQLRRVCNIAVHREDYMVSNSQFAARVNSLKERENAYKKLYESHHQLLDDLQSVVIELDTDLKIKFVNKTWETLTGYSIEESLGRRLNDFIAKEENHNKEVLEKKLTAVSHTSGRQCAVELRLLDKNNQALWVELKISRSTVSTDDTSALTICLDDITERKRTQEQLEHLAMHDSLTGLYNRHHFESSLEHLAADAVRHSRHHGLVYMDLDYFKVINDTFGHQKGDEVLREVSNLLSKRIRDSDLLSRLGGDEFAILLHDIEEEDVKNFAADIQKIVGEFSFQIQDQRINLGSSIGMTLIDGSTKDAQEYLIQADIALYVAKGRGRNLVHLYDPEDNESDEMRHNINWSQKIRDAINENRMLLYFQPVFDIVNNTISYYEALVRLKTRDGTIINPASFIPALENTGEMQLLDKEIISLAINTLKNTPQLQHIAINLSAQAFKNENLVPSIIEILKDTNVDPKRLTFELTESASLFNLGITQRVIKDLHALGCSFSVDDFGSGFSSFAYLKQLPADFIKLDGSYIQNLHYDKADQALVRAIVEVIQALGKKAVAEYVENEQILKILEHMGIDFVQGYHIGRPAPVEKLFPNKKKDDIKRSQSFDMSGLLKE